MSTCQNNILLTTLYLVEIWNYRVGRWQEYSSRCPFLFGCKAFCRFPKYQWKQQQKAQMSTANWTGIQRCQPISQASNTWCFCHWIYVVCKEVSTFIRLERSWHNEAFSHTHMLQLGLQKHKVKSRGLKALGINQNKTRQNVMLQNWWGRQSCRWRLRRGWRA